MVVPERILVLRTACQYAQQPIPEGVIHHILNAGRCPFTKIVHFERW